MGKSKIIITKETLYDLYITQNLGYRTIAPMLGVSVNTVRRRLADYDIKKTNVGDAISRAKKGNKYGSRAKRSTIDNIEHKHCTKCDNMQPLDEFSPWEYGADGLMNYCKQCERDRCTSRSWKNVRNKRQKKNRKCPKVRLKHNFSNYMQQCLKENKAGMKWETLVDYSFEDLRNHLEKMFVDDMSWDNMGRKGWHIDHIIPLKFKLPNGEYYFNQDELADPSTETFKKAWALDNLQPLWEEENIKKGNRYDH